MNGLKSVQQTRHPKVLQVQPAGSLVERVPILEKCSVMDVVEENGDEQIFEESTCSRI